MKLSHPTGNAVLLAVLGGALAQGLRMPLPWMVGPMLAIAFSRLGNLPVRPPPGGREAGQMIIGTAIGIFFTPQVVLEVANIAGLMLLAAAASILIGYLTALAVTRLAGVDMRTAFFASVPGGAAEMVLLGERYGAAVDFVAMSQSLRMMLVVLVIPPAFALSGVTGAAVYAPPGLSLDVAGLATLLLFNAATACVMRAIGAPTPWLLGPLVCTVLLSAAGIWFSSMPYVLSAAGQCLVGCSIGSRFQREFLLGAPRLIAASAAGFLLTLSLSVLCALMVAALGGGDAPTLILATAPGGIAEMSITAKVLGFGVPLVTAFHVTRLLVILTMTAPTFRLAMYLRHRVSQ